MLKDTDTPIDLMLRGFNRDEVLALTGIDIGYRGRALRREAAGIDRLRYKVEHVAARVESARVTESLTTYAAGGTKREVLALLGLAGANVTPLRDLYMGLDLAEAHDDAARKNFTARAAMGMAAKHGVTSAFALPQVQERGAQTRQERYGARYTLAAGSTLAQGARAKRYTRGEEEQTSTREEASSRERGASS